MRASYEMPLPNEAEETQDQAVMMADESAQQFVMSNPWQTSAVSGDQTLNATVDYQLFKAQYFNLRNQFNETFQRKVFAENIVYKGKRMKLTDEQTYEMVHSNLNVLDLTDDVSGSRIGNNAIIQDSPTQMRSKKSLGKQTTVMGSTMMNTHDQS